MNYYFLLLFLLLQVNFVNASEIKPDLYVPDKETEAFRERVTKAWDKHIRGGKNGSNWRGFLEFFEDEAKSNDKIKIVDWMEESTKLYCHVYSSNTIFDKNLLVELKKNSEICEDTMERIIKTYFDEVSNPEVGDLVVYYLNGGLLIHSGIYVGNDMVQSKWGYTPALFMHPKFYSIYGDEIRYFRVKKQFKVRDIKPVYESVSTPNPYRKKVVSDDDNKNSNNPLSLEEFRNKAKQLVHNNEGMVEFFEEESKVNNTLKVVKKLGDNESWYTHVYVLDKFFKEDILSKYMSEKEMSANTAMTSILADHFEELTDPKPGDVVAYYNESWDGALVNSGIFMGDGIVESQWLSVKAVFQHPTKYVPTDFGGKTRYFRQKKN